MMDALETVIALLHSDATVTDMVGDRIANKHRYGDTALGMWERGQTAITVRQEIGPGELYRPVLTVLLEIRCYAPTLNEGMAIWLRLVDLARVTERVIVQTANGQVLLYYFVPRSAATQLHDDDVNMDVASGMFEAMVYREALA